MEKKLIILILLLVTNVYRAQAQSNWTHVDVMSSTDTLGETASVIFDKQNRPWVMGQGITATSTNFLWGYIGSVWQSWEIPSPFAQGAPARKSMVTDTNNIIFGMQTNFEYFTFDINSLFMNNYSGSSFSLFPSTILNPITNHKWSFEAFNFDFISDFDGSSFTGYSMFDHHIEVINDAIIDYTGNLFVLGHSVNYDTLIAKYDGSQWTNYGSANTPLLNGFNLHFLTVDKANNIWFWGQHIPTSYYSFVKFNGSSFTSYSIPAPIKSACGNVFELECDSTNNLWLLADSGLVKFNGNYWTFYHADTAYPLHFATNMSIDKNNTIWITHETSGAGTWTGCLLFNENSTNTINGNVYNDANQNGIKDAAEQGMANNIVYSTSGAVANTDSAGNYYCWYPDSSATYTINHQLKKYQTQTSAPLSYTVTPASQSTTGYDFGIYTIPNVHDAQINASIFPARPGFDSYCYITYQNIGTTVLSDTVKLTYDPAFTYLLASVTPTAISGNTLKWAYSNFAPGSLAQITVTLNLSASAVIGDTLYSTASIGTVAQDTVPSDNIYEIESIVTGSFDPNEKAVQPSSNIAANEWLYYTIYFQNTGTDTAFTVIIRDTLDADLDFTTFEFLGSSHPAAINYYGTGVLKFTFNNILLPDSNTNEPLSHGFVSYRIKTKSNLAIGTQIHNTASIYFDFNSPIVTNTTQNIISNPVFITEVTSTAFNFQLTPNPAKDFIILNLNYPNYPNHPITISITDATGKTIFSTSITTSNHKLQTSNFAKGMYTVRVDDGKQSAVKKFVKE